MFDHVTLWGMLLIIGAAVAVTERRRRTVRAASGTPWPASEQANGRASAALAGIEAGRLVRHPLPWLGLLVSAAAVAGLVPMGTRPSIQLLSLNAFPLAIGLFAALHLAVSRDHRAGSDELSRTLPVGFRARTRGHLMAAGLVALPLGLAMSAATLAALGADRTLVGSRILPGTPSHQVATWTPGALELVQPGFVVLIAATVAVAVGRWWPHAAAAFAVPLLLFSPLGINAHFVPLHLPTGPRWQFGADGSGELLGHVTTVHLSWHLVFLAGYLLLAIAGALLRHDRRVLPLLIATAGLAAMITGFLIKVPSFAWLA